MSSTGPALRLLSALIVLVALVNFASLPPSASPADGEGGDAHAPAAAESSSRRSSAWEALRRGFVRSERRGVKPPAPGESKATAATGRAPGAVGGEGEDEEGGRRPFPPRKKGGLPEEEENGRWWSGLSECRYEGNCPRGTTCVYSPNRSSEGGFCQPYLPGGVDASDLRGILGAASKQRADAGAVAGAGKNSPNVVDESLGRCASACRSEVVLDERFYFKASVLFLAAEDDDTDDAALALRASLSPGRPGGCVVLYRRKFKAFPDDFPVEEWRSKRREAIVRVDPVGPPTPPGEHDPSRGGEQAWAALCYDPCEGYGDGDCRVGEDGDGGGANGEEHSPLAFACDKEKGTCQRRRRWIPPNADGYKDMVIVTGANHHYFRGLANLVASVRYWAPRNRVVVYNLGMDEGQLERVRSWPNVKAVEWEGSGGIPSDYPEHVREAKTFAWKLLAVDRALGVHSNMTLWLDAGSTVTAPLDPLELILERTGSVLTWGQDDDMTMWSMTLTYEYFNATKGKFRGYPHYSGGTLGFLRPSKDRDYVLLPAVRCANVRECIDKPPERKRGDSGGHRFDQTIISIIAYRPDVTPRHHTEYLAGRKEDLNANLSLPSEKVVYTSRQLCHYYADLMGWNDYNAKRTKKKVKRRAKKKPKKEAGG